MLSIVHGPTGAFIASKISNPLIAIPLIITSHFVEDYLPHTDVGIGINKGTKKRSTAFWQELLFDFPLSIAIVYFFFQVGKPFNPYLWLAWFIGLLPDFLEFPKNFLKTEIPLFKPFNDFHHRHHHSTKNLLIGVPTQILILVIIYLFK